MSGGTLFLRALLTLTLTLILAAPVSADHGPELTDPLFTRSLTVAYEHWGRSVPTCRPHGVLVDFPDSFDKARAEMPGCRIWMAAQLERRPAVRYCAIVVHEYGHLLGYPHTGEATSAMNPTYGELGLVPGCRREFRRCRTHRHKWRRHKHCRAF